MRKLKVLPLDAAADQPSKKQKTGKEQPPRKKPKPPAKPTLPAKRTRPGCPDIRANEGHMFTNSSSEGSLCPTVNLEKVSLVALLSRSCLLCHMCTSLRGMGASFASSEPRFGRGPTLLYTFNVEAPVLHIKVPRLTIRLLMAG